MVHGDGLRDRVSEDQLPHGYRTSYIKCLEGDYLSLASFPGLPPHVQRNTIINFYCVLRCACRGRPGNKANLDRVYDIHVPAALIVSVCRVYKEDSARL